GPHPSHKRRPRSLAGRGRPRPQGVRRGVGPAGYQGDRGRPREARPGRSGRLPPKRFGQRMVEPIKAIHLVEEERPIETLWDVTVAATAHARSIPNNDKRLEIERAAGELLKLAA